MVNRSSRRNVDRVPELKETLIRMSGSKLKPADYQNITSFIRHPEIRAKVTEALKQDKQAVERAVENLTRDDFSI